MDSSNSSFEKSVNGIEKYSRNNNNLKARHKFVFLGDANSGKTSLINRFVYDVYDSSYQVNYNVK